MYGYTREEKQEALDLTLLHHMTNESHLLNVLLGMMQAAAKHNLEGDATTCADVLALFAQNWGGEIRTMPLKADILAAAAKPTPAPNH